MGRRGFSAFQRRRLSAMDDFNTNSAICGTSLTVLSIPWQAFTTRSRREEKEKESKGEEWEEGEGRAAETNSRVERTMVSAEEGWERENASRADQTRRERSFFAPPLLPPSSSSNTPRAEYILNNKFSLRREEEEGEERGIAVGGDGVVGVGVDRNKGEEGAGRGGEWGGRGFQLGEC